jgi:hypothetical protein
MAGPDRYEHIAVVDAPQNLIPPPLAAPQRRIHPRLVPKRIQAPDEHLRFWRVLAGVRDEQVPQANTPMNTGASLYSLPRGATITTRSPA